MKQALSHDGFSFLEIMSQCPTSYGKFTSHRSAGVALKWFEESSVKLDRAKKMGKEELAGKTIVGTFADEIRPEFSSSLETLIRSHAEEKS
jgi:2-oxoglutarate ferredoxin oxidoreductase subunit beta